WNSFGFAQDAARRRFRASADHWISAAGRNPWHGWAVEQHPCIACHCARRQRSLCDTPRRNGSPLFAFPCPATAVSSANEQRDQPLTPARNAAGRPAFRATSGGLPVESIPPPVGAGLFALRVRTTYES